MKKTTLKIWKFLRESLNVGWKLGIVVIALTAAYCVYDEFDDEINELIHPWEFDHSISPALYVKYNSRDDCFQLYKWSKGKRVSRARYQFIYSKPDDCELTLFKDMDSRYGYLNAITGETVIPARYRRASEFSKEGIAAVVGFQDDSMRFITTTGELAMNRAFDHDIDEGATFCNGFCAISTMTEQGRRYGLIDFEGNWVLQPEYLKVESCAGGDLVYVTVEGENGETLEGRWNNKGYWQYQPVYQNITFDEYDNTVFLTEDYVKRQVAVDGTVIEPFVIDNIENLEYEAANTWYRDNEGIEHNRTMTSAKVAAYMVNGRYGLLDLRTGKPLTPAKFGCILMQHADLVRCVISGSEGELLYNSNGQKLN